MDLLKTQSNTVNNIFFDSLGQNSQKRKMVLAECVLHEVENDLDSAIDQYLQASLKSIEQIMCAQVVDYHPNLRTATDLIISAGGKRLRPRIILLIGKLLGAKYDTLINLAASIELLHTATLVHDDLIDGSFLRRGIPTLNAQWSPSATVLTGDFLFAAASDLAARTDSLEVIRLFSRTLMTIVNGEVRQLFNKQCNSSFEEYYQRIYAKTASLFETSARTAAVISNVNSQQVETLKNYGYELGLAFQMVDDILDFTGTEASLGKPVGSDIRQGLITLPTLHFMRLYPEDPMVQKMLSGKRIQGEADLDTLLHAISKSDAIDKSLADAEKYCLRAENDLMEFPDSPEREALIELTRSILPRN